MRPVPSDLRETFAVATDDVMVFNRGPLGRRGPAGPRLDKAMVSIGVVKKRGKDINETLEGVCIGVALEGGPLLAPPPDKLVLGLQKPYLPDLLLLTASSHCSASSSGSTR